MRDRDKAAEIVVTGFILRKQHQPVERTGRADVSGPRDPEHCTDDRLDPLAEAGLAERHRRIQPIAVRQRHRRETQLGGMFGDCLGFDRAFEHGEAGKDAQRDVRGHVATMGRCAAILQRAGRLIPSL